MTPAGLEHAPFYAAAILAAGGGGVLLAWSLRRHTMVSVSWLSPSHVSKG